MKLADERRLIEQTIRKAGDLLRSIHREPLEVLSAEGKDIKLQADRDSEQLIIDALRAARPYPVLGEESGETGGEAGADSDGPFWVIDPLDGTLNYSRGVPICCISIALVENDRAGGGQGGDRVLAGAIYDFNRDELFSAAEGAGATLNGRPIRVAATTDPSQASLSTGFPAAADYSTGALMPLVQSVQAFKKVRMIGSAATSLAWVACGRFDAYIEDGVHLWDIAAGMLLVAEAGGDLQISDSPRGKWARRLRCAGNRRIWSGRE
jgi:myo-inositol-1(or 4)-monophosphatase